MIVQDAKATYLVIVIDKQSMPHIQAFAFLGTAREEYKRQRAMHTEVYLTEIMDEEWREK